MTEYSADDELLALFSALPSLHVLRNRNGLLSAPMDSQCFAGAVLGHQYNNTNENLIVRDAYYRHVQHALTNNPLAAFRASPADFKHIKVQKIV